jgi:hypothetical protein
MLGDTLTTAFKTDKFLCLQFLNLQSLGKNALRVLEFRLPAFGRQRYVE